MEVMVANIRQTYMTVFKRLTRVVSLFGLSHVSFVTLMLSIALVVLCDGQTPASSHVHSAPFYDPSQPAVEPVDLAIYEQIRNEGLLHSQVMKYASALSDEIGPRLTGSANMRRADDWAVDQLATNGCGDAHLEDWGEFGTGWQQLNSWVRMTSPDFAVFVAQAVPWSASTHGAMRADSVYVNIENDGDFEKYRGKLAGKIVLLGALRPVPPIEKPLYHRYSDSDLADLVTFPLESSDDNDTPEALEAYVQRYRFRERLARFLQDEQAIAVIRPSRDQRDSGGSGGTIVDDFGMGLSHEPYIADRDMKLPIVVLAIENYGRVVRLLQEHVPVTIEMDVATEITGRREHGYNVIADIPGTDPLLKNQIVMVGAHLDSWASGTGATDNGAGSAAVLEVARILNTLKVRPRRTIRFALWSGEEEGIFGSRGYVKQHLADVDLSTAPGQSDLPDYLRQISGLRLKPEHTLLSVYFNVDYGQGRIRGVYLEGNQAVRPIFEQWIAPLSDLGVTTLTMRSIGSTDLLRIHNQSAEGLVLKEKADRRMSHSHHSTVWPLVFASGAGFDKLANPTPQPPGRANSLWLFQPDWSATSLARPSRLYAITLIVCRLIVVTIQAWRSDPSFC